MEGSPVKQKGPGIKLNSRRSTWLKRLGLVFLCIMTIPSWIFIFLWLFVLFVKGLVPSPMEKSDSYNWQLTSLGENADQITVNQVGFYEFVEGERSFLDRIYFPEREKLIYALKNQEQIKIFFKALANHQKPVSMCYPRVGQNYFRLIALDHSKMKEGTLTFHFCKIDARNVVVFEVDDSNIHSDYFASSELADFLAGIGIGPREGLN